MPELNERQNEIYRDHEADSRIGDTRPDRWASTNAYCQRSEDGRYIYDFTLLCPNGWKQYDTKQDAAYFGTWVHIEERKVFSYTEGDRCLVVCPTVESFRA